MSTASASPSVAAVGISSSHAAPTQSSRDKPSGHRVAREERHATGLRRRFREPAREPQLAELSLDRQPVAGLQLRRRRAVGRHLRGERLREREHLVVLGLGQHPSRPIDPTFLPVEVPVRHAGEACLELVGAPADERQVHVAVDEARNDRSLVHPSERHRLRGKVVRIARERHDPVVVPRHAAGRERRGGGGVASGGERTHGGRERRRHRRSARHVGSLATSDPRTRRRGRPFRAGRRRTQRATSTPAAAPTAAPSAVKSTSTRIGSAFHPKNDR